MSNKFPQFMDREPDRQEDGYIVPRYGFVLVLFSILNVNKLGSFFLKPLMVLIDVLTMGECGG